MATNRYQLVIGNKTWSSWSLRPWLAMQASGLPFDEISIPLRQPETKAAILRYSPSGFVPLLIDGDTLVWDSLAILEYLADAHPEAGLWPSDRKDRALARCAAAEMHSGFKELRSVCPMDVLASAPLDPVPEPVENDVRRIVALWRQCRATDAAKAGPFLFGSFTAADAMFAPVASRFRTYLPDLKRFGDDGTAAAYVDAIFAMPATQRWLDGARAEVAAAS